MPLNAIVPKQQSLVSKKNESPNKKRKTVYWRIAIAEQEARAKAVNASLTLENFDEAVNTTLQILGEGAGCDLINILENFFDIIQQLKLDFSSLHLYDSLRTGEQRLLLLYLLGLSQFSKNRSASRSSLSRDRNASEQDACTPKKRS